MANTVSRATIASVDKLGKLNAKIAILAAEAEAIKAALKATGLSEISGKSFKAVISRTEFEQFDSAKTRSLLESLNLATPTKTVSRTSISLYDL